MRPAEVVRAWPAWAPVVGVVFLVIAWGRTGPGWLMALAALALGGCVIAAVHHAEVVAHRVGEPFGSLVLAVAVTVIEVGLIVTLMLAGGEGKSTLARDTVFAALMITCNGILGLALLVAVWKRPVVEFSAEGSRAGLATVAALATFTLVLPTFTTSTSGPTFSNAQLGFAALASLALYGIFVFAQTIRHRDYFLPPPDANPEEHAARPSAAATWRSAGLLLVALVAVVGLAKTVSPSLESLVLDAGLPLSVVAVAIALLVLLPELLAAVRAARRGRMQTAVNLAYGSAIASIGLTIPAIVIASLWLTYPLELGLNAVGVVLIALTIALGSLTVIPGRATLVQGGVHLAVFAAFLVLAVSP